MKTTATPHHPAPPAPELPCVWVSAGVLSWRLCDREYACEGCPLYAALKGGNGAALDAAVEPDGRVADDPVGRYMTALGHDCTLHLDRAYSAEGLWLEPEAGGTVRVGFDEYTLRLLAPLDGAMMPRPGVWLAHGAPCVWLQRGRLAVALRAPLAGEVIEVHSCPSNGVSPAGDNGDSAGAWWFRLNPHESLGMAPGLLRNDALLAWFLGRVRGVRDALGTAMAAPDAVGAAMNDGGIPTANLEMVIGRERFESLVGTLFPLQG